MRRTLLLSTFCSILAVFLINMPFFLGDACINLGNAALIKKDWATARTWYDRASFLAISREQKETVSYDTSRLDYLA